MMKEFFKLAIKNISRRKIRSFLTVLGILIGMGAVVTLILIGEGANKRIENIFEKMGKDKITIFPGKLEGSFGIEASVSSTILTERDVNAIRKVPNVESVVPIFFRYAPIEFENEKFYLPVAGVGGDVKEVLQVFQGFELLEGRYVKESEKGKCVIGYGVAKNLFGKEVSIGNKLIINGKSFKVVGILEQIGSRMDDYSIIIPLEEARKLFDEEEEVSLIFAKVSNEQIIDDTVEEIKKKLKRLRGEEDFTILTQKQLLEKISSVLGILQFVLISVAAISLVVGSVGIMNSMYTSVMERTRDIGTMKAVGATNFQVMMIFLIEAGILGFFGGLLGVLLGIFLTKIALSYASMYGIIIPFVFDVRLFAGVLIFSFCLGMVSGILPARRAAGLDPVEALRYE